MFWPCSWQNTVCVLCWIWPCQHTGHVRIYLCVCVWRYIFCVCVDIYVSECVCVWTDASSLCPTAGRSVGQWTGTSSRCCPLPKEISPGRSGAGKGNQINTVKYTHYILSSLGVSWVWYLSLEFKKICM